MRKCAVIGGCFLLCLGWAAIGAAQEKYPNREITIVMGPAAGSSADLVGRALCRGASKLLKQSIVVVNKPGAASALALTYVKAKEPDGYNLGFLPSGPLYAQYMQKAPYDYTKDFTYIIEFSEYQQGILVRTDSRWKTFQEFIEYAKANPGKIRIGVPKLGAVQHLVLERLAMNVGAKWTYIPFESDTEVIVALLGNHLEAICASSTWVPNVDAGQFRLLAVCGGGERRMSNYPNVPTLQDLGYKITAPTFASIGGPKGLPAHVVDILHNAFKKAMDDPDFIGTANKFKYPLVYRGPEDLTKHVMEMNASASELIKRLGLQTEK